MDLPIEIYLTPLSGLAATVGRWIDTIAWSIYFGIGWLFIMLLLQLLLRRRWMVVVVILFFFVGLWVPGQQNRLLFFFFALVVALAFLTLLLRFGLLATMAWSLFMWLSDSVPLTPDTSDWYFGRSAATLLILAALAAYAFWISLAGRPLIGNDPLEHS